MEQKKVRSVLVILFLGCFASTLFWVPLARAEIRYVSDLLILTLREGPGDEFKVLRTVRTGMKLDILEEQERYSRVRTDNGDEGWVASRYLTSETPKSVIIETLKNEVESLKNTISEIEKGSTTLSERLAEKNKKLTQNIEDLQKARDKYRAEASAETKKHLEMKKKYDKLVADSKDVVALTVERDGLLEENATLKGQNEKLVSSMAELEGDNKRLMRNEILHWFLAGSGVFFVGLIIGKFSRRKKRY